MLWEINKQLNYYDLKTLNCINEWIFLFIYSFIKLSEYYSNN